MERKKIQSSFLQGLKVKMAWKDIHRPILPVMVSDWKCSLQIKKGVKFFFQDDIMMIHYHSESILHECTTWLSSTQKNILQIWIN